MLALEIEQAAGSSSWSMSINTLNLNMATSVGVVMQVLVLLCFTTGALGRSEMCTIFKSAEAYNRLTTKRVAQQAPSHPWAGCQPARTRSASVPTPNGSLTKPTGACWRLVPSMACTAPIHTTGSWLSSPMNAGPFRLSSRLYQVQAIPNFSLSSPPT